MKIKSIRNAKNIKGKTVFLRADFNIPIKNGKIKDDYKIISGLPTIRFLLRHKCRVIIATHIGRPLRSKKLEVRSKKFNQYSTKPIAIRLGKILGKKVKFVDNCAGKKVKVEVDKLKEGGILLLENLRFHKEEEQNDKKFAKQLSYLADVYVNNAFAVSHRKHASVSAIKKYLPSYAGLLIEEEVKNLSKILLPKKPMVLIIGGAKIGTKIKLIKKLHKKAHSILMGGALANNFFAARWIETGKSAVDKESVNFIKKFFTGQNGKNIILPIDLLVSNSKDGNGKPRLKNVYKVNKNEIILDIGPKTIKLYSSFIKKANIIIWNGPMGMFEQDSFKYGTLSVARVIASRSRGHAFGVVGGGETVEALKQTKMIDYIDWVSTGGGAMLAFLSGEKMPGLKGIVN